MNDKLIALESAFLGLDEYYGEDKYFPNDPEEMMLVKNIHDVIESQKITEDEFQEVASKFKALDVDYNR